MIKLRQLDSVNIYKPLHHFWWLILFRVFNFTFPFRRKRIAGYNELKEAFGKNIWGNNANERLVVFEVLKKLSEILFNNDPYKIIDHIK